MGRFGYLIKRIKGMDYSRFFDTVNFVHEKNGKNKLGIFFDIVHCG